VRPRPRSASRRGRSCLPRPTRSIRNDSPPGCPTRRRGVWRCGSISPKSQRPCRHHRRFCHPRLLALAPSPRLSATAAPWEARTG
jgi:hypothetical protein